MTDLMLSLSNAKFEEKDEAVDARADFELVLGDDSVTGHAEIKLTNLKLGALVRFLRKEK